MKMTINPQNWIDDSVEISINKSKKTVTVNGEVIKLNIRKSGEFDTFEAIWEGSQLCTGCKLNNFDTYYSTEGDIEREHKDPYVLAAIMACNLI